MNADDIILKQALNILKSRLHTATVIIGSSVVVEQYLTHKLALEEREIFGVIWLNVKNGVIAYEEIFFGSLTQSAVYPREVIKSALKHNAASAILFHNHPSGSPSPSRADRELTERLKLALDAIDIRVLDHVIVGGTQSMSFAEHGEL